MAAWPTALAVETEAAGAAPTQLSSSGLGSKGGGSAFFPRSESGSGTTSGSIAPGSRSSGSWTGSRGEVAMRLLVPRGASWMRASARAVLPEPALCSDASSVAGRLFGFLGLGDLRRVSHRLAAVLHGRIHTGFLRGVHRILGHIPAFHLCRLVPAQAQDALLSRSRDSGEPARKRRDPRSDRWQAPPVGSSSFSPHRSRWAGSAGRRAALRDCSPGHPVPHPVSPVGCAWGWGRPRGRPRDPGRVRSVSWSCFGRYPPSPDAPVTRSIPTAASARVGVHIPVTG